MRAYLSVFARTCVCILIIFYVISQQYPPERLSHKQTNKQRHVLYMCIYNILLCNK